MKNYFEIIDDEGVVESSFNSFDETLTKLQELADEDFVFSGDIKIVEVHLITR